MMKPPFHATMKKVHSIHVSVRKLGAVIRCRLYGTSIAII